MEKIFFWSGGYDSTLLVYKEVLDMVNNKRNTNIIKTWSLNWNLIDENKIKSERNCRDNFINYIRDKFNIAIYNEIININMPFSPGGTGLMQASFFLPLCAYLAQNDNEIVFGFHKQDDFWTLKYELESSCKWIFNAMSKNVTFKHPLSDVKKSEIIKKIREYDIERFCWTCERPSSFMTECGNCVPCKNKKLAEYELYLDYGVELKDNIMMKQG